MKPTARALNLLVALIATIQILGFPFSLAGGATQVPGDLCYPVVGAIPVLSALQMLHRAARPASERREPPATPPFLPALLTGALIGFISGAAGAGGGAFLAPIILAMNWVELRRTSAVTAVTERHGLVEVVEAN